MQQDVLDTIIATLTAEKVRIQNLLATHTPQYEALKAQLDTMWNKKEEYEIQIQNLADAISALQNLGE